MTNQSISNGPSKWFLLTLVLLTGALFIPTGCTADSQSAATTEPAASKLAEPEAVVPDPGNLRAFIELARTDLRLRKSLLIAQNLPLTEEEAAGFWPIQREYEAELTRNYDRRLELIRNYFAEEGSMKDAQAKSLANEVFDLEEQRTKLKRTYFKRFQAAIPASKAARFFQLDNQVNMLVDLQVAAALPLIK